DFPDRPKVRPIADAEACTDGAWICGGTEEANAQAGFSPDVFVEFRLSPVLRHDQIYSAIAIEVGQGTAALFAINLHPALSARHRGELTVAFSFEPKAAARIISGRLGLSAKEILTEENVLLAIPIKVPNADPES